MSEREVPHVALSDLIDRAIDRGEASSTAAPPRRLVGALLVLVACVAVGATAAAIRRVVPPPSDYEISVKLDWLQEHADAVDVLFVGSSVVHRQLDPRIVDRRMAELGVPLRSFNLGGPGQRGFETDYVLRQALAIDGFRPRVVVVEEPRWYLPLSENSEYSIRTVDWHDPRQALHLARSFAMVRDADPMPTWRHAVDHLRLTCWRAANFGEGPRVVRDLLGAKDVDGPSFLTRAQIDESRGYVSLEDQIADPEVVARRKEFLADPNAYLRSLERIRQRRAKRRDETRGYDVTTLREQRQAIEDAGARAIYFIAPWEAGGLTLLELAERGEPLDIADFGDPGTNAEFFEPAARFDKNHLTRETAAHLSEALAERIVLVLREHGKP